MKTTEGCVVRDGMEKNCWEGYMAVKPQNTKFLMEKEEGLKANSLPSVNERYHI